VLSGSESDLAVCGEANYDALIHAIGQARDCLRAVRADAIKVLCAAAADDDLESLLKMLTTEPLRWLQQASESPGYPQDTSWVTDVQAATRVLNTTHTLPPCGANAALAEWARGEVGCAAATVMCTVVEAAWLIDFRQLTPMPELGDGASSKLLKAETMRRLNAALPPLYRQRWRLLFSSSRDGASYSRLVSLCVGRAPCILALRDHGGKVLGGFSSHPLQLAPKFYGDFSCFVFCLDTGSDIPTIFRASGDNHNFVYMNAKREELPNGLAFGGQLDSRFFGLWLRADLESGRSDAPCATYQNEQLGTSVEFHVDEVEVWAVADDPPPPEWEQEEGGVRSKKHAEAAAFAELAGLRSNYAEKAPPPVDGDEEDD